MHPITPILKSHTRYKIERINQKNQYVSKIMKLDAFDFSKVPISKSVRFLELILICLVKRKCHCKATRVITMTGMNIK